MKAKLLGIFILASSLALCSGQAPTQKKPLTNADVIKMVKAELTDSTIILAIQTSPAQFDTGPDALIELKSAGVSGKVIDVMLAPRIQSPSEVAIGKASETKPGEGASSGDELPTAYGFYALASGKLIPLLPTEVERVFGLVVAGNSDRGYAVDGFSKKADVQTLNDPDVVFIVYEQGIRASAFSLAKLETVSKMAAGDFNISNTQLQFFENVYGVSPYESIAVNLLRPKLPIGLRVEPVPRKPDMYRLKPKQQLRPGATYSIYTSEALHEGDIIFTASRNQRAPSAILFKLAPQATAGTNETVTSQELNGATKDLQPMTFNQRFKFVEGKSIRYAGTIQYRSRLLHKFEMVDKPDDVMCFTQHELATEPVEGTIYKANLKKGLLGSGRLELIAVQSKEAPKQ